MLYRYVTRACAVIATVAAPPYVVVEAIAVLGNKIDISGDIRATWLVTIAIATQITATNWLIRTAQRDLIKQLRQSLRDSLARTVVQLTTDMRTALHDEVSEMADLNTGAHRHALHQLIQQFGRVVQASNAELSEEIGTAIARAQRYGMVMQAAATTGVRHNGADVVRSLRQRQGD